MTDQKSRGSSPAFLLEFHIFYAPSVYQNIAVSKYCSINEKRGIITCYSKIYGVLY